jgi:LCP family protein required for cell wall assembly
VKKSRKVLFRNFSILILSLLMLVSGVGCVYADNLLNGINYAPSEPASSKVATGSLFEPEASSGSTVSAKAGVLGGLLHDDAITNILLLGTDDYQVNDVGRPDSMLLVSVDTRHNKLKITSIMRDLYVAIPGYSSNKLNAAYSDAGGGPAGAKSVVRTIEANFGVDIDRYAIIDNSAFNKIIDRIGGVTVTLTDKKDIYGNTEADLINQYSGDSHKVHTGVNKLSGAQAHYYSRIRAIGDDFERTERQRTVFTNLVAELKGASFPTIWGIVVDIMSQHLVTTNMSKDEITAMASHAVTYLKYPVVQNRIPADNEYKSQTTAAGDSLVPDLDACRKNLSSFIFESDVPSKSYNTEG